LISRVAMNLPRNSTIYTYGFLGDMPHFKTKIGKKFKLEEIHEALKYKSNDGRKAILCFSTEPNS